MKTKQLVLCFGILSSTVAVSQPVINLIDVTPAFGSSFTTTNATYVEPGEGGANQVWDLSEMEGMESYTMHFEAPNGQPGISEFPSTTHVLIGEDEGTYAYMSYASNKTELLGFAIPDAAITMIYSDPRLEMGFPLSLNASFEDTWESEIDLGNDLMTVETGIFTATVDGSGTLITPAGTFTNVLRVHFETSSVFTTYMNGIEVFSMESDEVSYVFIKAGMPAPLATLGSLTMESETTFEADYLSDITLNTSDVNVIAEMSVYPNPANTFVETAVRLETSSIVNTALYSLDGRLVQQWGPQNLAAGQNQLRFDLPNVADGIYLLQIASPAGSRTEKIAVQH